MINAQTSIVSSDIILNYVPQRPPMVLISRIYKSDEGSLITDFDIVHEYILTQNCVLTQFGVIENMTQTAANMAGYEVVVNKKTLRVGFIASIKNLVVNYLPKVGNEILTEVFTKTQVTNVSIIEAKSFCNNELVATCEMKIFLQENA